MKHSICENSDRAVREHLKDKFFKYGNICITGLHACADLTIDAINLFLKIEEAKSLLLMPCCYHKMLRDNERQIFKNFPLSSNLKAVFDKHKGHDFLGIPFLRLASQPPSVDENLKDLVFNLLARALVQMYADKRKTYYFLTIFSSGAILR